MTLLRQLLIATLGMLLLLYAGNIGVGLVNARHLANVQMAAQAQHVATSLAQFLPRAVRNADAETIDALFNALSAKGFLRRIYYVDQFDHIVVQRDFAIDTKGAPAWFVRLIDLPAHEGRAEVRSGETRLGRVVVISHPGYAFASLWDGTLRQLWWLAIVTFPVWVLAYFALRWLLRPLQAMEQHANAIVAQQFAPQPVLPGTRELRRVVEAMNRMAVRLKQQFDQQAAMIGDLQARAHRDLVTGLSNPEHFDACLNSFVGDEEGGREGVLMLFAIAGFARINDLVGREAGNSILATVGDKLRAGVAGHDQALVARRQGPEFAVFVPDVPGDEAERLALALLGQLDKVSWRQGASEHLTITLGFTHSANIVSASDLLRAADLALRQVDTASGRRWCRFADLEGLAVPPVAARSTAEWRSFVDQVLATASVSLQYQKIVAVPTRELLGCEVFTRFWDAQGNVLSAGIVVPLAERFGRAAAVDRLVLETLVAEADDAVPAYNVNLCISSILAPEFCRWLDDYLARHAALAWRLVFEVSEHALQANYAAIRAFQALLAKRGSGLAVDHFGLQSSAFAYLGSLPLRQLKIHRTFVRDLDAHPDNQFYIKSLAQLAHSRDLQLVVEGVERDAEWQVLPALNVAAAQGYLLGYHNASTAL